MNKKTFLFLIHSLSGGGAERVMSVLCSNLVTRGYEVHLGLFRRTENDYPLDEGVQVHLLSERKQGASKIGNSLHRIKQFSHLIKEINPDFVVPFMGTVVIESFWASRFKKTTFISAVRVDPKNVQLNKLNKFLITYTYNHSDAVFVQNEMQRKCFSNKTQRKTFAVFNPVSQVFLDNEHRNSGNIANIATSGRLTEQKNHKMLIDVIKLVAEKHPEVKLTIYGEGKLREELENYIIEKKLEDNVKMFGRTNDMLGELQKNDIFVMSSNYEGMPNALLEAMALGMPCISTDCRTGPSDMIESYKNGILVPVKDAAKMAEAICYMIEHSNEANGMGKKARNFVIENCTVEIVIDKFINECMKFERKK